MNILKISEDFLLDVGILLPNSKVSTKLKTLANNIFHIFLLLFGAEFCLAFALYNLNEPEEAFTPFGCFAGFVASMLKYFCLIRNRGKIADLIQCIRRFIDEGLFF